MKSVLAALLALTCIRSFCQTIIEPYPLEITTGKTTNIIFPFAVKKVDCGARDVLAQKADNLLELKAAKQNISPTNVSVTTVDGSFYSFMVSYASDPAILNISYRTDSLLKQRYFLHLSTRSEEMKFALRSIYIKNHLMWFAFQLANYSQVSFEPEYVKFFVVDRHRAKRRAMQEIELVPLFREGMTFAFTPFTISKDKRLYVRVAEKNGGRSLSLKVSHKILLKAR